ncbi:hypothetical protein SAMN02745221_01762 [Thermosyntropha lipolytica DSM 11003]|uniref:Uncharacterized protein n=1 Tax=Thermosyntropha lipolytica DSM 11003 TaxID=1123382 RepID=A0A1M5QIS2_9FIRM|nr:hypothetical protein [Thermosyntropha lipolytica]SHH13413.1 hypothetical protein SAMN02745221_01762 [Thermosyntropha lipolytica DSM 11003]
MRKKLFWMAILITTFTIILFIDYPSVKAQGTATLQDFASDPQVQYQGSAREHRYDIFYNILSKSYPLDNGYFIERHREGWVTEKREDGTVVTRRPATDRETIAVWDFYLTVEGVDYGGYTLPENRYELSSAAVNQPNWLQNIGYVEKFIIAIERDSAGNLFVRQGLDDILFGDSGFPMSSSIIKMEMTEKEIYMVFVMQAYLYKHYPIEYLTLKGKMNDSGTYATGTWERFNEELGHVFLFGSWEARLREMQAAPAGKKEASPVKETPAPSSPSDYSKPLSSAEKMAVAAGSAALMVLALSLMQGVQTIPSSSQPSLLNQLQGYPLPKDLPRIIGEDGKEYIWYKPVGDLAEEPFWCPVERYEEDLWHLSQGHVFVDNQWHESAQAAAQMQQARQRMAEDTQRQYEKNLAEQAERLRAQEEETDLLNRYISGEVDIDLSSLGLSDNLAQAFANARRERLDFQRDIAERKRDIAAMEAVMQQNLIRPLNLLYYGTKTLSYTADKIIDAGEKVLNVGKPVGIGTAIAMPYRIVRDIAGGASQSWNNQVMMSEQLNIDPITMHELLKELDAGKKIEDFPPHERPKVESIQRYLNTYKQTPRDMMGPDFLLVNEQTWDQRLKQWTDVVAKGIGSGVYDTATGALGNKLKIGEAGKITQLSWQTVANTGKQLITDGKVELDVAIADAGLKVIRPDFKSLIPDAMQDVWRDELIDKYKNWKKPKD